MKNLLDDYIFSDSLRYEGHKLIYRPQSGIEQGVELSDCGRSF